jgi:hypothetical protein
MIQIQGCQRILCICLESHYRSLSTVHLPIAFVTETHRAMLSTWVTIWDRARIFNTNPQPLQEVNRSSGTPEWLESIFIWQIDICIFANHSVNRVSLGDIEYFCQNIRHWITYLLQSCTFYCLIIEVWEDSTSALQCVGYWDTAWRFRAKQQRALAGISWPLIDVLAQQQYTIQSRMMFLDL